jgi:hypothetical protein
VDSGVVPGEFLNYGEEFKQHTIGADVELADDYQQAPADNDDKGEEKDQEKDTKEEPDVNAQ